MKHRILLFGGSGQIGWELQRTLTSMGEVHLVSRSAVDLGNQHCDLRPLFDEFRPTVVVNAAAYTAVDTAETERESADRLNAEFPAQLAAEAKSQDALLVDYSTDYVFDGRKPEGYSENDETSPVNYYGLTKLKGLQAIQSSGCRHLVFRVTWVYSSRRSNFLKTILRLIRTRDSLNVIDDQLGVPTSARWVAEMTAMSLLLMDRGVGSEGVFNLVPSGETSWFGFAQEIAAAAETIGFDLRMTADAIQPIPTTEYPTPAARPANSRLSTEKLKQTFGFETPDWRAFVPLVLAELMEAESVQS